MQFANRSLKFGQLASIEEYRARIWCKYQARNLESILKMVDCGTQWPLMGRVALGILITLFFNPRAEPSRDRNDQAKVSTFLASVLPAGGGFFCDGVFPPSGRGTSICSFR